MALPFSEMAHLVGMDPREAQEALHRLILEIRQALATQGQYRLEGVGLFQRRNGGVVFQPDPTLALFVNSPYAGLESVELPPASPPAPPPPFADPNAFPDFEDDEALPESHDNEPFEETTEAPFASEEEGPAIQDDPGTEPEPFTDFFDDVWDEEMPEQDPHPLGPKPPPSYEEADFDVMRQSAAAEDVPGSRQEAASRASSLLSSFQRNPNAGQAAETLLLAARRYEEAGMTAEAAQLYGEFIKRFPEHPQANAARRALGWMEVGSTRPAPPLAGPPPTFTTPSPPSSPAGSTFEEWSPAELDEEEESRPPTPTPAPPGPPARPPASEPVVRQHPPRLPARLPDPTTPLRFEMAPPTEPTPLPPPPTARRSELQPPPPRVLRHRSERPKKKRSSFNPLYLVLGLLVLAALVALYFFFLQPRASTDTPRTQVPPVVVEPEPIPTDTSLATLPPPVAPPDNTDAEPLPDAEDPLMSTQPIVPTAGGFMWVMGSYPSYDSASEAAERYRRMGFRSGAIEGTAQGRRVYRVGVGQFATIAEAEAARDLLPETPAPGGPWITRIDS